jgi:hypothetical protein
VFELGAATSPLSVQRSDVPIFVFSSSKGYIGLRTGESRCFKHSASVFFCISSEDLKRKFSRFERTEKFKTTYQ